MVLVASLCASKYAKGSKRCTKNNPAIASNTDNKTTTTSKTKGFITGLRFFFSTMSYLQVVRYLLIERHGKFFSFREDSTSRRPEARRCYKRQSGAASTIRTR